MAGPWPFLIIGQRVKMDLIFPNANELTEDDVIGEFRLEKGKHPIKLDPEDEAGYLECVTKRITAICCINDESYCFNDLPYVGVRLNCEPYESPRGRGTLDIIATRKHQKEIEDRITEVKACLAELGLPNDEVGLSVCLEYDF